MRRLLVWLGIALGAFACVLAGVAITARVVGPIALFPGGGLTGDPAVEPAGPWGPLLEGVSVIQLEVDPEDPYSVNTGYVLRSGVLFVRSPQAARKRWPERLLADPRVVLRIRGELYLRRALRVTDPAEIGALGRLVGGEQADPGDPSAWYFRIGER